MNRREVVQRFMKGSTVLIVMPSVLTSCSKDPGPDPDPNPTPDPGTKITIDLTLAANSSLNSVGGSKVVQGIIVANTGSGTFIALDSTCTHEGCTVGYSSGDGNFQCPCHGSVFAKSGSVINGPASTALSSHAVSKTGDILTITV